MHAGKPSAAPRTPRHTHLHALAGILPVVVPVAHMLHAALDRVLDQPDGLHARRGRHASAGSCMQPPHPLACSHACMDGSTHAADARMHGWSRHTKLRGLSQRVAPAVHVRLAVWACMVRFASRRRRGRVWSGRSHLGHMLRLEHDVVDGIAQRRRLVRVPCYWAEVVVCCRSGQVGPASMWLLLLLLAGASAGDRRCRW